MTDLDPIDVRLGAAIRARRDALRITQAQLGSRIGVTFQQVQKYEKGVNRVSASRLVRIAEILDASAGQLLEEDAALDQAGAAALLQAWNRLETEEQRSAVLQLARVMGR